MLVAITGQRNDLQEARTVRSCCCNDADVASPLSCSSDAQLLFAFFTRTLFSSPLCTVITYTHRAHTCIEYNNVLECITLEAKRAHAHSSYTDDLTASYKYASALAASILKTQCFCVKLRCESDHCATALLHGELS
eukprot:16304-Heterococcus_DN1.PRE.2